MSERERPPLKKIVLSSSDKPTASGQAYIETVLAEADKTRGRVQITTGEIPQPNLLQRIRRTS